MNVKEPRKLFVVARATTIRRESIFFLFPHFLLKNRPLRWKKNDFLLLFFSFLFFLSFTSERNWIMCKAIEKNWNIHTHIYTFTLKTTVTILEKFCLFRIEIVNLYLFVLEIYGYIVHAHVAGTYLFIKIWEWFLFLIFKYQYKYFHLNVVY